MQSSNRPKKRNFIFTAFYILIAALAVFLGIAALQPSDFRITRSIIISAPPSVIFPQVNNPRKFEEWNPWSKLDPDAKVTFEGETEGVGATTRWDGNYEVGKGAMINEESLPNEKIRFRMEFLKPMEGTNMAEFTFKPAGDTTIVSWSMYGKNNLIAKAFGLIIDCEKMVGDQFEKGLKNLKTISESDQAKN